MNHPFDPARGLIVVGAELYGPTAEVGLKLALDTGASQTTINVLPLSLAGYLLDAATEHVEITTGSGVIYTPRLPVLRISALGQEQTNFPVLAHTLPPSLVSTAFSVSTSCRTECSAWTSAARSSPCSDRSFGREAGSRRSASTAHARWLGGVSAVDHRRAHRLWWRPARRRRPLRLCRRGSLTVRHEGARWVSHRTVTLWRKVTRNLLKLRCKMEVVVRAPALTKKGLRLAGDRLRRGPGAFEHQP